MKAVVIQSITPAFEAADVMGLQKGANLMLQVHHDSTDFILLLPSWKTPPGSGHSADTVKPLILVCSAESQELCQLHWVKPT